MVDCCDQLFFTVYRGDDVVQPLQLKKNGGPVDLSGVGTDVTITLTNIDRTKTIFSLLGTGLTGISLSNGKFALNITHAQSLLLALATRMDISAVALIAGKETTYAFKSVLTIADRP